VTDKLDRRLFLKSLAVAGLAASCPSLIGCGKEQEARTVTRSMAGPKTGKDLGLAIASGGDDPKKLVAAAIENLGGMGQFVSSGDIVVVKPNIGWSRTPEQAANTNPQVVEALVEMCLDAGARTVKVFDRPCNPARRTYSMSGIAEAATRAGADVSYVDDRKFKDIAIPEGEAVKSWQIYTEIFDADVLVNVPILKHHSMARVTMGMKNLMGLLGGNRESIHVHFDQKLADINTVIRPHLTVIDAFRVLKAHGPNAGTPEDVQVAGQVIAGTDPIAVDSYGARLFGEVTGTGLTGGDLGYIRMGHEMGLGEMDLEKVAQQHVEVA
jgi:uncharacterized protein (DUF362 family)